ncbi:MAG: hypothetical protein WBX01_10700 [Nitrososphaeraceae archaeon]
MTSSTGDGFVVLKSDVKLDVSAVYTTNDSIEVENIKPTTRKIGELSDLSIRLPDRIRGSCPTGQGSCVFYIEMEVTNLADVDAN